MGFMQIHLFVHLKLLNILLIAAWRCPAPKSFRLPAAQQIGQPRIRHMMINNTASIAMQQTVVLENKKEILKLKQLVNNCQ